MLKKHGHHGVWVLLSGGLGLGGCTVIHEADPYDDAEGCGAMGGESSGGKGGVDPAGGTANGASGGAADGGSASGGADGGSTSGGAETGGGTQWNQIEDRTSWAAMAGSYGDEEPPAECDGVKPVAFPANEGGAVIASDDGPNLADASRAFDLSTGTSWVVPGNPTPWVGYDFEGESPVIKSYELVASPTGLEGSFPHPKSWEFQATNSDEDDEDADWVTLDTQTDQEFELPYATHLYTLDNTTGYSRYRLFVTENGGSPDFELAEFSLFGAGTPVFSVDEAVRGTGLNQFNYSPTWIGETFDTYSERHAGTSAWSNLQGDWAEIRFKGTGIELYAVIDAKHGMLGLTLDDEDPTLVDIYGKSTMFDTLAYRSPRLCPGEHTLRIEVTGLRNSSSTDTYASLDRAVIIP